MLWGKLICASLMALCTADALAQTVKERHADLIHADLPIYGDGDEKWPQAFHNGDGDFGCANRVSFGDWKFLGAEDEESAPYWYRFSNYGVFHCFAVVKEASEREELRDTSFRYAFFVRIGETRVDRRQIELWALQTGGRPGSDYLLLAREPVKAMITRFDVLQSKCPRGNVRDRGGIDILSTRYCAINSKHELVKLAKAMARLEPLGTLSLEGKEADDSAPKADAPKP